MALTPAGWFDTYCGTTAVTSTMATTSDATGATFDATSSSFSSAMLAELRESLTMPIVEPPTPKVQLRVGKPPWSDDVEDLRKT